MFPRRAPLIWVARKKYSRGFRKNSVPWAIMIVRFHRNGLSAEES